MALKFSREDRRFVFICLAVAAAGTAVGLRYFSHAFPEASLQLTFSRPQASQIARQILETELNVAPSVLSVGRSSGWREASRFDVDDTAKVYLERTLGLDRANALYGREARVWRWDYRWFRSGEKEEWRASVTPAGDFVSFEHLLPEGAPGKSVSREAARREALSYLKRRGLAEDSVDLIEASPRTLPARVDWTLVFERRGFSMGEATVRYRVAVSGNVVSAYSEFVKVPEKWKREYARLRSANETASNVDMVFLLLTVLAMIGLLVQKMLRHDVPWKLAAGFAAAAFVLALFSLSNSLSVSAFEYDTASPYTGFMVKQLVQVLLGSIGQAALIAVVVAAGEPVFRERFPGHLSAAGAFSSRGLRTRSAMRGIVLGYAMTAFFLAYQILFYLGADRLGAWAPAEVPYDDILNTSFPWATVLFMGFFPAVSEEFISRIFSISFLDKLTGSRWIALLVPAFIWGFGHSAYPNQPFYIRGVEVGLAGILVGLVFRRFGIVPILVWHFTVDATYTALLLIRSGNLYYVVSGSLAAGALLIPLLFCLWSYRRRGGFEPEEGLRNGDLGFVPAPEAVPESAVETLPAPRLPQRTGRFFAGIVAAGAILFLLPADPPGSEISDRIGRAGALSIAKRFLHANGASTDKFKTAVYTAAGFAHEGEMEEASPEETAKFASQSDDAVHYVLKEGGRDSFRRLSRDFLPTGLWAVRFVEPGEKSEWKLLIDASRGRVAAFAHPAEENAVASPPPSLDRARARAIAAAQSLGYPSARYSVVDAGTVERPRRTDTRIVLEARVAGCGLARPRLIAVFHGGSLCALYPALKLPEEYLRARDAEGPFYWTGVAAKLIAAGILVGAVLLTLFLELRRNALRVRRLLFPGAILALLSGLEAANGWPQIWRQYRTTMPVSLFEISVTVGFLVRIIGAALMAFVAFSVFEVALPGWRKSLRLPGAAARAFPRAALSVLGLLEAARFKQYLATRYAPAFAVGAGLPDSLNSLFPAASILYSTLTRILLLAGIAAAFSLVVGSQRFGKRRTILAGGALALLLALPISARSLPEAVWPTLATLVVAGFTLAAIVNLLGKDPLAWLFFGLFAFAGKGALELVDQSAAADRAEGIVALGLVAFLSLLLAAAGRQGSPPLER